MIDKPTCNFFFFISHNNNKKIWQTQILAAALELGILTTNRFRLSVSARIQHILSTVTFLSPLSALHSHKKTIISFIFAHFPDNTVHGRSHDP